MKNDIPINFDCDKVVWVMPKNQALFVPQHSTKSYALSKSKFSQLLTNFAFKLSCKIQIHCKST